MTYAAPQKSVTVRSGDIVDITTTDAEGDLVTSVCRVVVMKRSWTQRLLRLPPRVFVQRWNGEAWEGPISFDRLASGGFDWTVTP